MADFIKIGDIVDGHQAAIQINAITELSLRDGVVYVLTKDTQYMVEDTITNRAVEVYEAILAHLNVVKEL